MDKQKISMINLAVSKLIPTFVESNTDASLSDEQRITLKTSLRAFFMPTKDIGYGHLSLIFLFAIGKIKSVFDDGKWWPFFFHLKVKRSIMNTFEFFDQCLGLLPASATLRACKVRTIQGTTTVSIAYMVGSQIYRSLFEQKGGING